MQSFIRYSSKHNLNLSKHHITAGRAPRTAAVFKMELFVTICQKDLPATSNY